MTPPPQRLKCIHRMVCFRHNGEGADKEWGTDAGCIPDCNQYVILASHSSQQSEREKLLNEKLASRYKKILMQCEDIIEDTRRKYEIAPKTCDGCSAYDLCKELRQKDGEP